MTFSASPYIPSRKYVFIDGNYFCHEIDEMRKKLFPDKGINEIFEWSNVEYGAERIFFYDALPSEHPGKSHEVSKLLCQHKEIFLHDIARVPNFHVRLAKSTQRAGRRSEGPSLQQKGVDVLLAIEVLHHAFLNNMDIATIVTGDLDFLPVFEALTKTRVQSELLYRPKSTSVSLIEAADRAKFFNFGSFIQCLKPIYKYQVVVNSEPLTDGQRAKFNGAIGLFNKRNIFHAVDSTDSLHMVWVEGNKMILKGKNRIAAIECLVQYDSDELDYK